MKITRSDASKLTADNVNLWYIAQGATDKVTANAMYADACKVIDAYKTLATIKSEAAAVTTQINALPAKASDVKLTDKDAIVAAYDAYDALAEDAQKYVTNTTRMNADIEAVKALEEYDLKVKAAALPKVAAATTANKEAIKEFKEAYNAYADTTAYESTNAYTSFYDYETALNNIKTTEQTAIVTQYNALNAKRNAGTLTADDTAEVKALQDAIAAYIDEYSETPNANVELETAKIAATVAKDAEVTADDVKAYLNTLKVTVKSSKTSKKYVKITGTATVKATGEAADFTKFTEAGYTFKYKFYRSTKAGVNYKVKKAKDTNSWINTAGTKGTKYYYKVKVFAYDKDGNFVGQTYQSQCNYTSKVFGK